VILTGRTWGPSGVWAGRALGLVALLCGWALRAQAQDTLATGVYVRIDDDDTTVVSPRVHVRKRVLDATDVDATYSADVWTSASVDIRASASLPVTEQRDELEFGVSHELTDLTLSGTYRYSVEHDYVSHGAFVGATYDFADNNANLAFAGYALFDTVGRAGYPAFAEPLTTLGGRLSFTQVIDPQMFAQLTYELAHLDGYQASPYRKVGLDGTGFGCEKAVKCLDEHEPSLRTRHVAALLLRRALGDAFSVGLSYRFIIDDWGLTSHTASLELGLLASESASFSLRYRFYTQTGVDFYAAKYISPLPPGAYTTRDREQSPMHDQRVGLDWQQTAQLTDAMAMTVTTAIGGSRFDYADFVGLKTVYALELTVSVGFLR
jgi:hypothetical protein